MEDVAVEIFNGFVKRTVSYGALKPKTSVTLTLNCKFTDSQRKNGFKYIYPVANPKKFCRVNHTLK